MSDHSHRLSTRCFLILITLFCALLSQCGRPDFIRNPTMRDPNPPSPDGGSQSQRD